MNIYIEFFSALPQNNWIRFHGGGNYTRNIIRQLLKMNEKLNIILLCPSSYIATQDNEPELYNVPNLYWMKVDCISENIAFQKNSILYFPMLGYLRDLRSIVKIREKNANLKICATLHDVRFLEYTADYTDKYYKSGLQKQLYPLYSFTVDNLLKKIIKRPALKKCLRALDEVYTVSNYSMQKIITEHKTTCISLYYQSFTPSTKLKSCNNLPSKYVLFVSGARPIKNLSHALIGFSIYKDLNPESTIKLVVTGTDKNTFKNLCQLPKLNKEIIRKNTVLFEYVSNEELADLYMKCRFVLYTSKNEGFGLPVLEAAAYGKTCICSNVSSIPEVMGSSVVYVPPFDDFAIAKAIAYLCDDDRLAIYENRISAAFKITQQRMQLEQENFVWDLLDTECMNH